MPRRDWRRCASAAAWAWPCASNATEPKRFSKFTFSSAGFHSAEVFFYSRKPSNELMGETRMGRVAVVTGGTRGIGQAISLALKHKGFRVAANYAGNDVAARQFQADSGIPIYKWDVSDYAACQAGLTRISHDLGPIDVLVNNAGITRD